jgi:inositol transport system permease protein
LFNFTGEKGKRSINFGAAYGKYGIFVILLIIFLISAVFVNGFFTVANLTNVMRQVSVVTILALGATFVITLGHVNVAYGSLAALIGCIAASVMVTTGNLFMTVMAGLGMGVLAGTVNGVVITTFRIPAFIMTLAVTTVARGAVHLFTGGIPITGMGPSFAFIGQGNIGRIPFSAIIAGTLFIFAWIILRKTALGRHIYAVGGNENAAKASGINTKMVQIKAFIIDGIMVAFAGIVLMSRMNSGQPGAAVGYEFNAITAVVVGGTSLAGGSGSIAGTIAGAFIVGIINNTLNLLNVHSQWQRVVQGIIILIAVIIDVATKNASKKRV